MKESRNPFRLRTSEHIEQDATFLRLFERARNRLPIIVLSSSEQPEDVFVTAVCVLLDPSHHALKMSSAGHPFPWHMGYATEYPRHTSAPGRSGILLWRHLGALGACHCGMNVDWCDISWFFGDSVALGVEGQAIVDETVSSCVRTVVDLRWAEEIALNPSPIATQAPQIRYVHASLLADSPARWRELSQSCEKEMWKCVVLEQVRTELRDVLRVISAAPAGPPPRT